MRRDREAGRDRREANRDQREFNKTKHRVEEKVIKKGAGPFEVDGVFSEDEKGIRNGEEDGTHDEP